MMHDKEAAVALSPRYRTQSVIMTQSPGLLQTRESAANIKQGYLHFCSTKLTAVLTSRTSTMDQLRRNFQSSKSSHWGGRSTPSSAETTSPVPPPLNGGSSTVSSNLHPYSSHQSDAAPVISGSSNQEDEERCVICLESLSFSFRLPGEKPQIVPECGHALHDACFTAVYGPVIRGQLGRSNLGLCGVCRRPMKLGDGDNSKGNSKLFLLGLWLSMTAPIRACGTHWCWGQ